MAGYIALYKKNDKQGLENIFINMAGYVDLLRNHIAKENNILFKMADRVLSEEGVTLFTGQDIKDGQNTWQSIGGQEVGTA